MKRSYNRWNPVPRGVLWVAGEDKEAKECAKCGEMKILEDFHKEKSNKDGRRGDCRKCNTKRVGNYRKQYRTRFNDYERQRREKDREAYNKNHREWAKKRRLEDDEVALSQNIRAPLWRTIRLIKEGRSDFNHRWKSAQHLGYSVQQLKLVIESRMKPGMTWDNHGEWHVDHKIPLLHFIRKGVTDIKVIHALCNLQPLWAGENWAKGNKHPITGEVA